MSKGDFPALRMTIDGGRLVPAGQFDAERLNSYRRGTVVYVRFTEEKDRVLVRKWWAILGLVVKQCETPWKTKEEASEAIKLALGIVNLSKTVGGNFMQYPRSLTELDDPEMTEALENMTELLSRMTGVDVETLKKETAHLGSEPDDSNSDASLPPAASEPGDGSPAEAPDEPGDVSPEQSPGSIIDCAKEFLALAQSAWTDPEERDEAFAQGKAEWEAKLPAVRHPEIKSITVSAYAVATGKRNIAQARSFLSETLQCKPEDLGVTR